MSSSEYEQYLMAIGASVLQQQAAEQPETRPSGEAIQRAHLLEKQRAERIRVVNEARERARRMEAERLREASDQRRINDVLMESEIMAAERQKFLSCVGNLPEDFDALWPQRWKEIQAERVLAARQRSKALNAF